MSTPNRNDPCPCGSGKKYKKCCLGKDTAIHINHRNALQHSPAGANESAVGFDGTATMPMYYGDLGNTLLQRGNFDAAIENYRRALSLKPDLAGVHSNLGVALQMQGKLDAAAEHYRQALSFNPDFAEAHNNLGLALQNQGKLDMAIASFYKALSLQPDYAEAYNNLGFALQNQGEPDLAIANYHRTLSLKPNYADAHVNLGNLFQSMGKPDEAISCYRQALSINPDFAGAHMNMGNAFKDQGKLDEAINCYQQALLIQPDFADAYMNMGTARKDQGRLDEATASFRKALELKPDFTLAYSALLFFHAYQVTLDPDQYLSLARGWEQACVPAADRLAARRRTFRRTALAGRRLRVGYVSGDFRQHAVSYFVEQLFARHDRTRVELFAYSTHGRRDAVTERLQAMVDRWVPITGVPDDAARDRIEADGIDVLIDLSGHTAHGRLGIFARRAAPVQAHYLGYFAGTGLTEMDYWVGDEILTPAETDPHFSERVWRLPRVWVSYEGKVDAPQPDWRPDADGTVWIGSFNNLGKLTPATLALWAQVLHALPHGRLLLKTKELADAGNRQRTQDALAGHGIPAERIELQSGNLTPDWASHMAYYNRLDIALDPVGAVGGGTTTCDALWMGVPVIALEGDRMAARMTASMLGALDHPDWIARSEAEYVNKVVALAADVELRKTLRPAQRGRMASSPLCDARGLASRLEDAYSEMFGQWLQQRASQE
jgi:protein O-GlcNAc transferase